MSRPSFLAALFWLAFADSITVLLSIAADVWLRRSDPVGRGLTGAYEVLILPFPVLGVLGAPDAPSEQAVGR